MNWETISHKSLLKIEPCKRILETGRSEPKLVTLSSKLSSASVKIKKTFTVNTCMILK